MRGFLASSALLLVTVFQGGCIIFPTYFHSVRDTGRHPPEMAGKLYDQFQEGATTREQIHERLGRRDVELADGRLWVYTWEEYRSSGWKWILVSLNGGGAGDIDAASSTTNYLMLEFDGVGVLRQKKIRRDGHLNSLATCMDDAWRPTAARK